MSKHGINVPKGVAVSSVDEVKKTIRDVFPNENEVIVENQSWGLLFRCCLRDRGRE